MSSTIASVSSSTFTAGGTRLPSRATTPSAKAMSVAIGMPQPLRSVAAGVEREEDRGGHDHPAERGHRRQRDGAPVAQLAGDELALDLHPDDEEEHRHQQVVDDVAEVLVEHVRPDLEPDVRWTTTPRSRPSTASSPTRARRPWRRRGRCRRRPRCARTGRTVAPRARAVGRSAGTSAVRSESAGLSSGELLGGRRNHVDQTSRHNRLTVYRA